MNVFTVTNLGRLVLLAVVAVIIGAQTARAQPAQGQNPRTLPKVAVYVTGGKTASENKALSARITHALVSSGRYSTIERSDAFLDQVAKEQAAQRSGAIDDRQISKLGQQAGASFVCVGEMLEAFGAHQISARIVNVESVEVIASGLASGQLRSMADFATLSDHVVASLLGVAPNNAPNTIVSASADYNAPPAQNTAGAGQAVDLSKNQPNIVVNGATLEAKLLWLQKNAVSNTGYLIELRRNENVGTQSFSFKGKSNVRVWLKGVDGEKVISLSADGPVVAVGAGVTLILDSNITLWGKNNNTSPLVRVMSEGALIMNAGAKITGNTAREATGGVCVDGGGSFTMNGGEITSNSGEKGNGGGVYVDGWATFTMKGGVISGNQANQANYDYGSQGGQGGGVFLNGSAEFLMKGGEISGNSSHGMRAGWGGGVYVGKAAIFTMEAGVISGNKANSGGGVWVNEAGRFTMKGGNISENDASSYGCGVYVKNGIFTMDGGEISGNKRNRNGCCCWGGGVRLDDGRFVKNGGIIYGYIQGDNNSNYGNDGHAVSVGTYGRSGYNYARNTTAGPKVKLDSSKPGAAGGWE